ncbi:MAG: hypothetical protein ACRDTI_20755 [Mycobacterium sp.]
MPLPAGHEQAAELGTIAMRCDDCEHIITADVQGMVQVSPHQELPDRVSMALRPNVDALNEAINLHRARGCRATHFTQCEAPSV